MTERIFNKWGRFVAPTLVVLVLAFAFVATPLRVMADSWVSGFLRDTTGNLDVNCAAGCAGSVASPSYVAGSGIGNYTVVQPTGSNLHIACDSGCGVAPPYNYVNWNDTSTHIIKSSSGTLGYVEFDGTTFNASASCTWYDNASTASGTVLFGPVTSMGPTQHITFGGGSGKKAVNGIVLACTGAAPGGNGVQTGYL